MKRGDVFFYLVVKTTWNLSRWWDYKVRLHLPDNWKVIKIYNKINSFLHSVHVNTHNFWFRHFNRF